MSHRSTPDMHPAKHLVDDLKSHLERDDEPELRFISSGAIQASWPEDPQSLRKKLGLHKWSAKDNSLLHLLTEHCRTAVCVLAYIKYQPFSDILNKLCRSIVRENKHEGSAFLKDSQLPLDFAACKQLFSTNQPEKRYEEDFYRDQFVFLPISISAAGAAPYKAHPQQRWPFVSDGERLSGGAFGDVFKVEIARGYLEKQKNSFNKDTELIAYKRMDDRHDWKKEVKNLNFLKGALIEHPRWVVHIAAFSQGDWFFIFLPYTPLGDLEKFLMQHPRGDIGTSDGFDCKLITADLSDLAREFTGIIDATKYLHDEVSAYGERVPVFCAHADLKPANILIFPSNGDPVGNWRITDFGLANVRTIHNEYFSMQHLFNGKSGSSTTQSNPHTFDGRYVAPERQFLDNPYPTQSDIWSLGCILTEVLIFSLGTSQENSRRNEVEKFRRDLYQLHPDRNGRADNLYDRTLDELEDQEKWKVNIKRRDAVDRSLKRIYREESQLYQDLAELVHHMLQPDPQRRCSAAEASKRSRTACQKHSNFKSTIPAASQSDALFLKDSPSPWEFFASNSVPGNAFRFAGRIDDASDALAEFKPFRFQPFQRIPVRIHQEQSTYETLEIVARSVVTARISPLLGCVVYLSRKEHHGSSTKLFAKPILFELQFGDVLHRRDRSRTIIRHQLPQNTKWKELQVGGEHVIVTGHRVDIQQHTTYIYNLNEKKQVEIHPGIFDMDKIVPAAWGAFAARNSSHFIYWQPVRDPLPVEISPPMNYDGQVVFGSKGSFLFTCSRGASGSRDVVQVWSTDPVGKPRVIALYQMARLAGHRQEVFLIPCGCLPVCILRDGHGSWFTASAQPKSDKHRAIYGVEPQNLGPNPPSKLSLCAANERNFIFISRRTIYSCDLTWESDIKLKIGVPKQLADTKVRDPVDLVLRAKGEERNELIICNSVGAVEKIEMEC